ncbi:CGL151 [Auxenochlorella protothecoides x Auxenochlorella symbiontica]|uniref:Uncharacterized protein n=1 Tax=Auxenochlorella protothecoides TaxID=3075 RepID=A0A1D1ZRX0_AUXPR
MGKAKPAHHTSAELRAKARAATQNVGGGAAGKVDRLGGQAGHQKFRCTVCGQSAPDIKTAQIHFEAKHPKMPWDPVAAVANVHELHGGVTTKGVAVRGSMKK